jgi:hypothetical protein
VKGIGHAENAKVTGVHLGRVNWRWYLRGVSNQTSARPTTATGVAVVVGLARVRRACRGGRLEV